MCEANAYLIKESEKKLIMEAVDTVEPEEDGISIRLVSIFGEQKIIKASIHSLSLVDHNIFLKDFFNMGWELSYRDQNASQDA